MSKNKESLSLIACIGYFLIRVGIITTAGDIKMQ
jgi:hypothetical protein